MFENQIVFNKFVCRLCLGLKKFLSIVIVTGVIFSCSSNSSASPETPRPSSPPSNPDLTVGRVTSDTISLSWTASDGADHYVIDPGFEPKITNQSSQRSYTLTNLNSGTLYTLKVTACNDYGCSSGATTNVTTTPDTPKGFSASSISTDRVDLTWNLVDGATSYVVYQNKNDSPTPITTNTGNTYRVTGLTPEAQYTFGLAACNAGGCSSITNLSVSTSAVDPGAPDTPKGFSASSISTDRVDLTWDLADRATSYVVYQNKDDSPTPITTNTGNTYTVTGLTPEAQYTFGLAACNAGGCSSITNLSVSTSAVDPGAPDTPKGFSASSISTDRVDLTWDLADRATSYVVYQDKDGSPNPIATNTGNTYRVTGLTPEAQYTFGLAACNAGGCSSITNLTVSTSAAGPDAPDTPKGFSASSISTDRVDLTWDLADRATSYVVYRYKDGAYAPITTNTGNTYTATNLIPGVLHTFGLAACNAIGCSSIINLTVSTIAVDPDVPDTPINFSASSILTDRVDLTWDLVDGATSYVVYQDKDGTPTPITANTGNTYTVTGLTPETQYTFGLEACNAGGCSSRTNLTLGTLGHPPNTPKGFSASSISTDRVDLTWVLVEKALAYTIYQYKEDTPTPIAYTNGNTYTVTNLIPGVLHTFGLAACNAGGCSSITNLSVSTIAAGPDAPDTPKGLTVSQVTSSFLYLSWTASDGAIHYVIDTGSIKITNTSSKYTLNNLKPGTLYPIEVVACNDYRCSAAATTNVTTVPDIPGDFTAKNITSASVTLDWSEAAGATYYEIQQLQDTPTTITTAASFRTVVNLKYSTVYYFYIRACNFWGCSDTTTQKEVKTSDPSGDFGINYPYMDSGDDFTINPVFINSETCNILKYTESGEATYTIKSLKPYGRDTQTLPTIDERTGVVKNNGAANDGGASPGIYQVIINIPGCTTNVNIYNTVTPVDKRELAKAILAGIIDYDEGFNFNFIDTSQIRDMSRLFTEEYIVTPSLDFNGDISKWDTSQVTNMSYMFSEASAFNRPLNNWDTSQVQDMSYMFRNSVFNQPLSNWDTSQVQYMEGMFYNAASFNQHIGGWKTSNVTDMEKVFFGARAFNYPLNDWDTSQVTNMKGMFRGAAAFNYPLNDWDTSQVRDMSYMFFSASQFNQDLRGWVVTNVTAHDGMFTGSPIEILPDKQPTFP